MQIKQETLHRISFPVGDMRLLLGVVCVLAQENVDFTVFNLNTFEFSDEQEVRYLLEFSAENSDDFCRGAIKRLIHTYHGEVTSEIERSLLGREQLNSPFLICDFMQRVFNQSSIYFSSMLTSTVDLEEVQTCIISKNPHSLLSAIKEYNRQPPKIVIDVTLYPQIGNRELANIFCQLTSLLPKNAVMNGVSVSWHEKCNYRILHLAFNEGIRSLLDDLQIKYSVTWLVTPRSSGVGELCDLIDFLIKRGVEIISMYDVAPDYIRTRTLFSCNDNQKCLELLDK